ncbi:hypothetical protein [Metapseudomonas otitidis]|uniref:hypothetical protein n=1 Tax=Metapseudomonas otitidis TaxID=319939 RepID=UPI00197E3DE1|nr:hypothetical protein [Pseudomonas otitidis]
MASYEVIAYPANGQRVGQSGFDPATATRPVGAEVTERYRRALGACLARRGYSVN